MSDWNQFFASLRKYLDFFRAQIPELNNFGNGIQTISDGELVGLLSWTNLAAEISLKDHESRRQIYEDRTWNCIESATGLVASPVPLILKGALYKFLAALAIDEVSAINIWNSLLSEGVCVRQLDGKLIGIQQDLDERESQLRIYDCTEGFLTLMNELLSHKTRPNTKQIAPYLQYIANSILSQFPTRSYNDSEQMWRLVKLALDSLYQPLKTFYATPATVENKLIEVQILTQLLSDSPLSRTLLQIIAEGANRLQQKLPISFMQGEATCSAIRLLYYAISNQTAIADAIRAVNSEIMVVSIESILCSPIPHMQQNHNNYLSLLFQYISEVADQLIKHTFFVWLILKEATAQRPSLQPRVIQALLYRRSELIASIAFLSIFSAEDISIKIDDLSPTNVDFLPHDRIKGEVCRLMFEVFNEAMESDPDSPNIAYALMDFDLRDIHPIIQNQTYLHNLIEIVLQLSSTENPFTARFSGLYEPALRLLLRMCSVKSSHSNALLRYFRSQYDLIYRLSTSSTFRFSTTKSLSETELLCTEESNLLHLENIKDKYALLTGQKSLQGMILELIALELSSLIRSGHIEQPHRYLKNLLAIEQMSQSQQNGNMETTDDGQTSRALLWLLLDSSRIYVAELNMPHCNKFDPQKIEELLALCIRKNSYGVDQFDVPYLHLLLNSEMNCIMNTEIDVIREEARSILNFCVRKNSHNLLESSCTHLLEGWLSLINVLAVHATLPIIHTGVHQHLLVDALFLLRDYCNVVEMSPELAASVAACITRIIRAICTLFSKSERKQVIPQAILPILHLLLQCIVLPGYNKSVTFKVELYASCLRTLDLFSNLQVSLMANGNPRDASAGDDDILNILLFNKVNQGESRESTRNIVTSDSMVAMVRHEQIINDLWVELIGPVTHEVVQTLTSDIIFAPLSLKMLAMATFVDILREDCRFNGRIAKEFIMSGSMKCVDDTLTRLQTSLNNKPIDYENRKQEESLIIALKSLISLAKSCRNFIPL